VETLDDCPPVHNTGFAHCALIVSGGEGASNLTLAGQTVVTGARALGERYAKKVDAEPI
jgi:hypothetical protein